MFSQLALIAIFLVSAVQEITPSAIEQAVESNRHKVREFSIIADLAKELDVRVWIFGGSAASFAHYVKWDLERQKGDNQFPLMHFDYNLLSVFRPQQDIDLVIDGTPESAKKFREQLSARGLNLNGSHRLWDIRLLRGRFEDRYGLLDDFDFQNQHTDSHSTGLIELTTPSDNSPLIKDAKYWNLDPAPFLSDVAENKIHFYHSPRHHETSRAQQGLNPEILSVIRYLTKMFQFKLNPLDSDWTKIKAIIEQFEPNTMSHDSYAWKWLKKNIPHMLSYSINLEYTFDVLNSLALPQKIKKLEQPKDADSLSHIISREPLRSKPLGTSGLTAAELGVHMVSHLTRSPEAIDSINRSPSLEANVLVSRIETPFEHAAYGTGFYTRKTDNNQSFPGAWVTLFEVDPRARLGSDFILVGGNDEKIVLFRNKKALKILPSPKTTATSIIEAIMSQKVSAWDANMQRRAALSLDRQLPLMTEDERGRYLVVLRQIINPEEANLFKILQSIKPLLESDAFRSDVVDIISDYLLTGVISDVRTLITSRLQWLTTNQLDRVHEELRNQLRKKISLNSASIDLIRDLKSRQLTQLISNHIYDLTLQLAKKLDEQSDEVGHQFTLETIQFYDHELSRFFSESSVLDTTRLEILYLSAKHRHGVDHVIQHIITSRPSAAIINYVKHLFPPNYIPSAETFRLLIAYSPLSSLQEYFSHLKGSGEQAELIVRLLLERANREVTMASISKNLPDGRDKTLIINGILNLSLNYIGRLDGSNYERLIHDLIANSSSTVYLMLFDGLFRFYESIQINARHLQTFFDHLPTEETTLRIFAQKLASTIMIHDLRNYPAPFPIFDRLIQIQNSSAASHPNYDPRATNSPSRLTLVTNFLLSHPKKNRAHYLKKNFFPPLHDAKERFLAFLKDPTSSKSLRDKVLTALSAFNPHENLESSWRHFQIFYEYSELNHPHFDWIRDINGIEDQEIRNQYFNETLGFICPTLLAELK